MAASRRRRLAALAAVVPLLAGPPWLLAVAASVAVAITVIRAGRSIAARRRAREPSGAGGIDLGRDGSGRRVEVGIDELSAHGLILGASGAGKTTTLLRILTQQIRAGQSVVAIDMKGSPGFARALEQAAAGAGRPFQLFTLEGGASWNPLQHGNPTELKDKLIATERFTEPHYQRAAERYLQIVLRALQVAAPERAVTLEEVVQMMDPRRLPGLLRALPDEQANPVRDYLAGLTGDQLSAIRGFQTRLALITESEAGRHLSPSPVSSATGRDQVIDLRAALEGPGVVVFSLNSSTYGMLASQVGTLAVQDLVAALGRRLATAAGYRSLPATIAIDEFSGLGGDHVVSLFARVREAGGGVLVATQEMADLDRAAAGLRDQVIGNTAFKVVHRQDVPASARLVAQMGGTHRVWEETRQIVAGVFAAKGASRGTRREVERFILDPNAIMTLRPGQAALISKLGSRAPQVIDVAAPTSVPGDCAPIRGSRSAAGGADFRRRQRHNGPTLE